MIFRIFFIVLRGAGSPSQMQLNLHPVLHPLLYIHDNPSFEVPVGETEYAEALALAESVVNWAENILKDKRS